jgi:phosphomevalonate kinase
VITAKAPGKLYIAGEYAVVETGHPAIVVAIDQFVTVSVGATTGYGSIVSKQYQENSIYWQRVGDEIVFDDRDNPFHYILSAIRLTEKYAREMGHPLALYDLKVDSDLDSEDGKKYGLGSSAAVTVATVKALNQFYGLKMTADQVYKLSAIAHLDVQGNGSLGDIAASVYGGWVAYRSFDKQWLAAARRQHTITELLNRDWPQLDIELLTAPANMQLLIGWTGSPASTAHLVDRIADSQTTTNKETDYQNFLQQSDAILERIIAGFRAGDLAAIQQGIRDNQDALNYLTQFSGVEIETPVLLQLRQIAERFGGAAKSSGAGGGDCGIALIDTTVDVAPLLASWTSVGIEPLNLCVHESDPNQVAQHVAS